MMMMMVMSRDQNAGQNRYIQIGNESFETVEQFQVFGNSPNESKFHSCRN
jgi:hypothetical protein